MPTQKVSTAEVAALYHKGLRKAEIARQTGVSLETVSRRLTEAGITGADEWRPWTEQEMAIIRAAAPSHAFMARDIEAQLPGRSRSAIETKLASVRAGLGLPKRGRRSTKHGEPALAITRTDPPRPGTYRDRRGVTLKALSFLEAGI